MLHKFTQLIKVSVDAIWTSYWANQAGFQKGAPSIHQHSLSSLIVLRSESIQAVNTELCIRHYISLPLLQCAVHSHRTHSADVCVHSLLHSLRVGLQLGEEEINFIIVPVIIVRYNCWAHKFGIWWKKNFKRIFLRKWFGLYLFK